MNNQVTEDTDDKVEQKDKKKKKKQDEWKAINIQFEYPEFQGKEKWIVATDLSEEDLIAKYPKVLLKYKPYILVPYKFLKIRNIYRTNDQFYFRLQIRCMDIFPVDDEKSASFHKELWCFNEEPDYEKHVAEKQNNEDKALAMLQMGIATLTPSQKKRLIAFYVEKKTIREIAIEEKVCFTKVEKSMAQILKKLKKFLKRKGISVDFRS